MARLHERLDAVVTCCLGGQIGTRLDELCVDATHLLVDQRRAVCRIIEMVLGFIALYGSLVGLYLLRQQPDALQKPFGRLVRRVELGAQLLLDIGIHERVRDPCRFYRIARGKRHFDRGRKAHGVDGQLLQEIVDRVVELPDLGIRFRFIVGKQPMNGIECDQGRQGVEFRVLHQVQLVDDLRRQIAGGQHLNLVLHGGRIGRHVGQDRRKIGDVVLARIEHHHRRRSVVRRPENQHQQCQRERAERDIANKPSARAGDPHQVVELKTVPSTRGAVAGIGDRSGCSAIVCGHAIPSASGGFPPSSAIEQVYLGAG